MTSDRTQPSASSAWLRRKRARLLLSCALGTVIGIAAPAGQAQAQAQDFSGAFRGSMQVVAGSADRASPAPNTDVITVNSRSAVVNWTPFDSSSTGVIDFLPSGATATFQGAVGSDFAILNRILPNGSARIGLNGTIISQLRTTAETTSRGGTVVFYTPNGFIVGSSAVFNIGNLLMTTINPLSIPKPATSSSTLTATVSTERSAPTRPLSSRKEHR
jgi:filamentous hemagglutinin family protein